MQIIYDINFFFLEDLRKRMSSDYARLARMSIIEEGTTKVCLLSKGTNIVINEKNILFVLLCKAFSYLVLCCHTKSNDYQLLII